MNDVTKSLGFCQCALPAVTGDTKCCENCLNNPNRKNDCIIVTTDNTSNLDDVKKMIEKAPITNINSDSCMIEVIPQMYQMISDVSELEWFFNHVIQKPQVNESYSAVFVSRHKKLSKEEQKTLGLTRRESEFLSTISFKNDYRSEDVNKEWTFERFLKTLKRFNVDKGAYTTGIGTYLPEQTLAVIFYVNPCDDVLVADELSLQIQNTKTALTKALLSGVEYNKYKDTYRLFCNLESNLKHLKAQCKGSTYWMDFDLDCPEWFRNQDGEGDGTGYYFDMMKRELNNRFGRGNYVIVSTSGGYHILVRTTSIKSNPHDFCNKMNELYKTGVTYGDYPEYLDENGNDKFECVITASHQKFNPEEDREVKETVSKLEELVAKGTITKQEFKVIRRGLYDSLKTKKENNRSSIPGIPLPGTYQYGREVKVINKDDFE